MPWKSFARFVGRSMALVLALGVGAVGFVVAGGYGVYRYFRGSGGVDNSHPNGLDEERKKLIEPDETGKDEPDEDSGEELVVEDKNRKEDILPNSDEDETEYHNAGLLGSLKEDKCQEEIKEPRSPTQNASVKNTGRNTPAVNSASKTSSTPPVAPKPKQKSRSIQSPTDSSTGRGPPIRSPNAVPVMLPGLAEEIARRKRKEQKSPSDLDSSSDHRRPNPSSIGGVPQSKSPVSRNHQMNGGDNEGEIIGTWCNGEIFVNGISDTSENTEGVSFEEPTQRPKLAFPSRNKGPSRRPPTTHKSPSPVEV